MYRVRRQKYLPTTFLINAVAPSVSTNINNLSRVGNRKPVLFELATTQHGGEWTVQQRAFAVERVFRNNDSYTFFIVRDFRKKKKKN